MPRWLLWTAAAVVSWGVWAVIAKVIGDELTGAQSQVLSTVGMVPVILILARSKDLTIRSGGRRGMLLRAWPRGSSVGSATYLTTTYSAAAGTAATAVSLTALYPIVTILLAAVFLAERVNRIQAVGLVLALVAIYLFNVSEEGGLLSGWLAYAFVPLVMWGVAGFLSKLATGHLSGGLAALLVLVGFLVANVGAGWQPCRGRRACRCRRGGWSPPSGSSWRSATTRW